MAVIYHVEHGDTRYDAQGKAQGLIDDGLSSQGKAQALRAGRSLKGLGINCIYHSPLRRARETAQIIASAIGAKCVERPGLRPPDIGTLAGKANSTVRPYLEFFYSRPTLPFPNGEKIADWYPKIRKEWLHQFADDDPVIAIVSHARDWQTVNNWARNGLDAGPETVRFNEPKSAQVVKVTKTGNKIKLQAVT